MTKELIGAVVTARLELLVCLINLVAACFSLGSSFSFCLESLGHDVVVIFFGLASIGLTPELTHDLLSHKEYVADYNPMCFLGFSVIMAGFATINFVYINHISMRDR